MKRLLLLLLIFVGIAQAQTNTARMLNGINAQTGTSYTFVCSDATKLVTFNNVANISASLFAPTDACSGPGIMFSVKNVGSSTVTITPVSGTIDGSANLVLTQGRGADIWNDGTGYITQGSNSAGPPPSNFPRLDQVTDPILNRVFGVSGLTAGFSGGGTFTLADVKLVMPTLGGCSASSGNTLCYDSSSGNVVVWFGQAGKVAVFPDASTFTDGDLVGVSLVAGQLTLKDLGPPAGGGTGGTPVTAIITNITDNQTLCWDTTVSNFINCSVGVPVSVKTADYTIDPVQDRGTAILMNSASPHTIFFSTQISDASSFDANWFAFFQNINSGTLTLLLTAPSVFATNGTQTETLAQGQQCSVFTDQTAPGTAYLKCSEPRTTASGPIVATRTPYGLAIGCPTCGTSTGNLSGSLTSGKIPVASGANTLIDSTASDDGSTPTRTPNGINTANNGNYTEWTVDTGGVTANKLVCRSSSSKVQICATSTTQGVIGVALTTQTSGQTVKVCWAAKCSPISSNATTTGHWLIPSTSVAGDVDDTGSTNQPAGTQSFLAESSVGGGAQVLTTLLAADNIAGNGGGKFIQINGANVQPVANFVTGGGITPSKVDSGNTSTITLTVGGQYKILTCETGLGDGLNSIPAGTYLQFFCVNRTGVTWTLTNLRCWTDNNGTSTMQAANNAATNLLTSAVTCNNTKASGGAAGTQSGTTTLADGDAVSFTFVADGTTKQTTWTVTGTY